MRGTASTLQALELIRIPHEMDPNAVGVFTLEGVQLGFIARDRTSHVPQPVTYAQVQSTGHAAKSEFLGGLSETRTAEKAGAANERTPLQG